MADNIHKLRDTYGPALRDYYVHLLNQPIPRELNDLLSMLKEAAAQADADAPPDSQASDQVPPSQKSDTSD